MNAKFLKAIRDASDARLVEIAMEFAARYPQAFAEMLGVATSQFSVIRPSGTLVYVELTPAQISQIKEEGTAHGKIGAIRELRELTKCDLWTAKELVEQQRWFE